MKMNKKFLGLAIKEMEEKNMFMIKDLISLNDDSKIPDNILCTILKIYEFGTTEDLNHAPNNLVCNTEGKFWTTWDKIFEIRYHLKLDRSKNEQTNGGENENG